MDPVIDRRTIREFTSQPVAAESVAALLRAAMAAPSAGDERPWHFVVIRDSRKRETSQAILPDAFMITQASVAILLCGDESLQKHVGCWALDCAAAAQNMLIEAQLLELGAVGVGVYPVVGRMQRFRDFLKIPANVIPFELIAVGHPAEYKEPEDRFDRERVHYDGW